MTALDVRTAAQTEADSSIQVPVWFPAHDIRANLTPLARQHFVEGAVWGAALVTPTREQIAEVIDAHADIHDGIDIYATADVVLALMKRLSGDGH